jgi:molybdate transport system substrate-binding protein
MIRSWRGRAWPTGCLGALLAIAVALAANALASPPALAVFGAADLAFALGDLAAAFEHAAGTRLTIVLGSTGTLAMQLEHGARADVFLAADARFVDRLQAADVLLAGTRVAYAEGRLALVTAAAAGVRVTSLAGLADRRVRRLAIAHPAHAPYGRAAEEVLRGATLWDTLGPRLVYGDNVRHALQLVQSGAAEAGLVARALAEAPGIAWVPVDPALHAPLRQEGAVMRRSRQPDLGRAFLRFLTGPAGRATLRRHGFGVPDAS